MARLISAEPPPRARARGKGWFYRIRLTLLVSLLLLVGLYAWNDVRSRQARTRWERPLTVGLVFLRLGPVEPEALATLAARAPEPEDGDSLWDRVRQAFALWRYTRDIDERADVPTRGLDSRIYVVAEPRRGTRQAFVEGFSQSGGRIGVARVELDGDMVDLALFVAAHELFHTLGAADKYDDLGRTKVPDGLALPEQSPLFPQPGADVMARNRVLSPEREEPPETLEELWVGPATAREIGWAP